MFSNLGYRFRIVSVILLGVAYFVLDVIEGAMFEVRFDELMAFAVAGYAVFVLVIKESTSILRIQGSIVAVLYVLLALGDIFYFVSGGSWDEVATFFVTFIIAPLILMPSLMRRMLLR